MSIIQRDPSDRIEIIDTDGDVHDDAVVPDLDEEQFISMYERMRIARQFDERAVSLQRQGRLGTYPPMSGQEATQIGSAMALSDDDWVSPSYREHGVLFVHGMPLAQILRYWMGDERGNRMPEDSNLLPVAVPIATQIPQSVGVAWALKHSNDDGVVACYFGDGATSEGDFHEGLNFAGVMNTPSLFICSNNQWAISVPRTSQTASETLAQKATAYGFAGVQVDGMDPLAVYAATTQARTNALDPNGRLRPTLIESVTYRFGAHTTADDPSRYRPSEEVEKWKRRDPIPRFESFLVDRGILDTETIDAIANRVTDQVDTAIEDAETTVRADPEDIFEYVYEDLPAHLERQRDWLRQFRDRHGDDTILEH